MLSSREASCHRVETGDIFRDKQESESGNTDEGKLGVYVMGFTAGKKGGPMEDRQHQAQPGTRLENDLGGNARGWRLVLTGCSVQNTYRMEVGECRRLPANGRLAAWAQS